MILCLIGTNPYSFDRLIKKIDQIIAKKYRVVIQMGNTNYKPVNSEYFDFCKKDKIESLLDEAKLVITQGGYGSMMDAIKLQKKIIAVPRSIELNESLDNQIELVQYFENKKYVVACYDIELLESLVKKCLNNEYLFKKFKPESETLIKDVIKKFIDNM